MSSAATISAPPSTSVVGDDAPLARATMRRVSLTLLPFLFVLYIFNFLDRTNVGIAALQMNRDLGFSASAYGLGAGIFFVGYALFEVPSNLILARIGARRWIARIMISWGLIAAAMMFVRTPLHFYALRLLLGVAEAGFFPGIIYYLSLWFPAPERARATSRFMIAIPLAAAVGNPLGVWLLGLDGLSGLRGWQWLFLVEGLPSVLLGVGVLALLRDGPEDARWLSREQRDWLAARMRRDQDECAAPHGLPALRALLHPLVWLVSLVYFLAVTAHYGYTFWAPLLIRDALRASDTTAGLVTAAIGCLAAAAMLAAGAHSDRTGERALHAAAGTALASLGYVVAALFPSPMWRVTGLALVNVGIGIFLTPFWCLPSTFLRASAAAAGIAFVNSIGNLGGLVGPYLIGRLQDATGSNTAAFLALAALALLAGAMCIVLRRQAILAVPRHARRAA